MSITVVGSDSANSGTTGGTAPSVTLPSGVQDGDLGLLVVGESVSTTLTAPAGWTVVDGPEQGGASVAYGWLCSKTLTAADSGTTITGTFANWSPWAAAVIVVRGGSYEQFTWASATASTETTNTLPAFTPTADDCLAVLLMNLTTSSGQVSITTAPPSGWTEQEDTSTNYSSFNVGAYIATKQLAGQGGTEQASTTCESNVNHRAGAWMVTVAPAAVPQAGPSWWLKTATGAIPMVTTIAS